MRSRAEDVTHFSDEYDFYYWTPEGKKILQKLMRFKELEDSSKLDWMKGDSLLIGVIGKSGVGKTALLNALSHEMRKTLHEKTELPMQTISFLVENVQFMRRETFKHITSNLHSFTGKHTIFIDTPDYAIRDVRKINGDLTELSKIWKYLRSQGCRANIVIFFQKELVEKTDHFFLRKITDIVELKPLSPQQLIEAFKLRFKTCEPFSEEALKLIAELSRGVFRRFKRYIQLCLEDMLDRGREQVKVEDVKDVITTDVLMRDLDLELSDIFRNERYKRISIAVLKHLREHGSVNQKTLAEVLGVHATILGRILSSLEEHGYVKRERGKKRELIIKTLS